MFTLSTNMRYAIAASNGGNAAVCSEGTRSDRLWQHLPAKIEGPKGQLLSPTSQGS